MKKMMVYGVFAGVEYEGERLEKVFKNKADAIAYKNKLVQEDIELWEDAENEESLEENYGYYYEVREIEVC